MVETTAKKENGGERLQYHERRLQRSKQKTAVFGSGMGPGLRLDDTTCW
ncbi:hypothetical protein A2U01_0029481 [Trifolium medium]|uniref:Uncharacterized protein n=1 Tax=Trifolium medium TaxID=97028 RepID=A0A392P9E2_9FABA|nr:hypothetical protein [Trifolium medium]